MKVVSRRAFKPLQKRELYFRARGRCVICRVELGADWHADHVQPFSAGGETTIENGQALCAECNLRKGASVDPKPRGDFPEIRGYARDGKRKWVFEALPAGTQVWTPEEAHPFTMDEVGWLREIPGYQRKHMDLRLPFGMYATVWERDVFIDAKRGRDLEFIVHLRLGRELERFIGCQSLPELLGFLAELKPLEIDG